MNSKQAQTEEQVQVNKRAVETVGVFLPVKGSIVREEDSSFTIYLSSYGPKHAVRVPVDSETGILCALLEQDYLTQVEVLKESISRRQIPEVAYVLREKVTKKRRTQAVTGEKRVKFERVIVEVNPEDVAF